MTKSFNEKDMFAFVAKYKNWSLKRAFDYQNLSCTLSDAKTALMSAYFECLLDHDDSRSNFEGRVLAKAFLLLKNEFLGKGNAPLSHSVSITDNESFYESSYTIDFAEQIDVTRMILKMGIDKVNALIDQDTTQRDGALIDETMINNKCSRRQAYRIVKKNNVNRDEARNYSLF